MFLSYDTIGYLKGPDIALVKDAETGTVAVRKKLRAALGFDPIRNRIGEGYVTEEEKS